MNPLSNLTGSRIFAHPYVSRSMRGFVVVLLAITAFAKMWMIYSDPFYDVNSGLSYGVLSLAIGIELWLIYENLRNTSCFVVSLLNVFVFGIFALFAITRWILGYSTCACAGSINFHPFVFAAVDLILVSFFLRQAFILNKPNDKDTPSTRLGWWHNVSPNSRGRCAAVAALAILVLSLELPLFEPIKDLLFGSRQIQAKSHVVGELVVNKEFVGEVWIYNQSSFPAKIVGVQQSCNCITLLDTFGLVIPGRDKRRVPLIVRPGKPGSLYQRAVLFLEHPEQFRVSVDVLANVKG